MASESLTRFVCDTDGCGITATVQRHDTPRGWMKIEYPVTHRIGGMQHESTLHVCNGCVLQMVESKDAIAALMIKTEAAAALPADKEVT